MEDFDYVGTLGIISSILILFSILTKNVMRFRTINLIGSLLFTIYGYIISAFSVMLSNGAIVLIDIFYIWQLKKSREAFDIQEELNGHSYFIKRFIEFYNNDIMKYFYDFDFNDVKGSKFILVLRNLQSVGIFIYDEMPKENAILIHLDYACPKFRDMNNFFYILKKKEQDFKNKGFTKFISRNGKPEHVRYLLNVGFKKIGNDYVLEF